MDDRQDHPAARQQHDDLDVVTGIHLMQGIGHRQTVGFWADAWAQVLTRPSAIFGLAWIGVVAFFACFAPVLASGHPLVFRTVAADGSTLARGFPLIDNLTSMDWVLLLGGIGGAVFVFGPWGGRRSWRLGWVLATGIQAGLAVLAKEILVSAVTARGVSDDVRAMEQAGWFPYAAVAACVLVATGVRLIPRLAEARSGIFYAIASVGAAVGGLAGLGLGISNALGAEGLLPWLGAALLAAPGAMVGAVLGLALAALLALPIFGGRERLAWGVGVGIGAVLAVVLLGTWKTPLTQFQYRAAVARGEADAVYTLLALSPQEGDTTRKLKPPGSTLYKPLIDEFVRAVAQANPPGRFMDDPRWEVSGLGAERSLADVPLDADLLETALSLVERPGNVLPEPAANVADRLRAAAGAGELATAADVVGFFRAQPSAVFVLGTDSLGQDVLSQMLHACRLSISIGLVSTGIAVVIGVTIGALMGYFGGWVDLVLYRVVEIFMSIPTLFLLIVAAAVLPRNTYVMMAIIGCVTWTGAARFIRAEFYKLRGQDFVQSARAVGLPLRSILFKHMLPNGVTPVLVEASFAIAAAILIEATLSFLGLGPANQASWGRLLSDATNQVGDFVWWLAIFPGLAIFLTVLSYNFVGEALRDAIDPKLKKARV